MRNATRRTDGNYGRGVATIDADLLSADEVANEIRLIFESPSYQPPLLPRVALEVHRFTKDPNVGIPEVVRLLEGDPILAADVLRVASSAAYATGSPPRSLGEAASRLGLDGVRDVVFQVALSSKLFRAKTFEGPMEQLRAHSVAVAVCTREVAAYTAVPMEHAFLFGLLHDVGVAAILIALAECHPRVTLAEVLGELGPLHEEAGALLVRAWKLPSELSWLIGAHHASEIGGHVHPLLACGVVGHHLANNAGAGLDSPGAELLEKTPPAELRRACDALGVDSTGMVRLAEATRDKLR